MSIRCSCPECAYEYEIADDLAGKEVLCPECQTRFKPKGSSRVRTEPPLATVTPTDLPARSPARSRRRRDEEQDDEDDRPRQDQRRAPEGTGAAVHSLGIASLVLGVLGFVVSTEALRSAVEGYAICTPNL
jgi:hypothetical protein